MSGKVLPVQKTPWRMSSPCSRGLAEMSELTFNIADYRPLFRAKTHETGHAIKTGGGFVVLSANSPRREHQADEWYGPHPSVVDIRTVREAHRPSPRRG